jgi:ATP-dependent DNA helicase RecG
MSREGQLLDKKSLRSVQGRTADWSELVKDCVAFANATGGHLLIGIEDGQSEPPAGQRIPASLPDTLRRKLAERTVNVSALPDVVTATNGGQ